MAATAEEILGQARLIVRKKAPYFRAMLVGLVPKPVEGLGTIGVAGQPQMGVTRSAVLVYDPAWIATKTPDQCAGLLAHEIMHLLNRHGERCGAREHRTFNMAGDLSINPTVRDMGFQLPTGKDEGLWPKNFGWDEGLTADEYYRRLQEMPKQPQGGGVGNGTCGSCADGSDPGSGNGDDSPEGDKAGGGEGRSQREMDRMVKRTAEAIKEASKSRGTVPAGLERWADLALVPPKVSWQSKLAHAIRRSCAYRPGAVVTRYDHPSRRQAGIGYGPGRPMLPRLRSPVPNVAIVVDTSGSMGQAELTACLREARGVLHAVGAGVSFFSCDADVHGTMRRVEDPKELPKLLVGGGGTDFRPPFKAMEKMKPRPEVAIYMTDGMGPAPATAPTWCHTIWLLVGPYKQKPCEWGSHIEVDD